MTRRFENTIASAERLKHINYTDDINIISETVYDGLDDYVEILGFDKWRLISYWQSINE